MAQAARRSGQALDEPIVSLETDKVAVEVPSPVAGVMGAHAVKVGDTVAVGALLATVEPGAARPLRPRRNPCRRCGPGASPAPLTPPASNSRLDRRCPHRSPPRCAAPCWKPASIPASVKGTGKDGRLTKEDVIAAAAAKVASPAPRRLCPCRRRRPRSLLPPAGDRKRRARQDDAHCARPSPSG